MGQKKTFKLIGVVIAGIIILALSLKYNLLNLFLTCRRKGNYPSERSNEIPFAPNQKKQNFFVRIAGYIDISANIVTVISGCIGTFIALYFLPSMLQGQESSFKSQPPTQATQVAMASTSTPLQPQDTPIPTVTNQNDIIPVPPSQDAFSRPFREITATMTLAPGQPTKIPRQLTPMAIIFSAAHTPASQQSPSIISSPNPQFPDCDYLFQPGDKLETIADTYGITFEMLLTYNNIADVASIQPGDIIRLPGCGRDPNY